LETLILPKRVTIRLVGANKEPVRISDVLIVVHVFASRKNDFFLQPFRTDANGEASITKRELLAEAAAHYDSGLMDYEAIEESRPLVEIRPMSLTEIGSAISSRSRVWTTLLKGECKRWSSIEQLIDVYRRAANERVSITPVRASWHLTCKDYDCPLPTSLI
jgi:hypothetical protein